jgi:hypothetical protein
MSRPAQPNPEQTTAAWDSAKVSETFRAFAQPLLDVDPAGPPDLETLQTSTALAMMCWNLPLFETTHAALFARTKQALDSAMKLVPRPVAACLKQLIATRTQQLAAAPYLVTVEVQGTSLKDARIVAEARTPAPSVAS